MHFCGDIFHDVFVNAILLFAFYPQWLPFATSIRGWYERHLSAQHPHDHKE